ncbi:MAG: 50S ribosomal protein L30 [Bacteroidales bacterium]|nr:50S ribosomal protein L30 [Bacteroidales bacterium]
MSKIKVKLVKSTSGSNKRVKATLTALGIGKVDSWVEHENTPQIKGMVRKVLHLVEVEE